MRHPKVKQGCIFILLLSLMITPVNAAGCHGRFINPINDVCWDCIFPITLAGMKIAGSREDTENPRNPICWCPKPPLPVVPGIPISLWEPARLVDVTRTPYCLVNFGGIEAYKTSRQNHGHGGSGGKEGSDRGNKHSFYQVHWYIYPLLFWLELLVDFACMERVGVDIGYLTEIDPMWEDDEMSFLINPEAILFGNPLAEGTCIADCLAADIGFPMNGAFWCNGCQGSLYPFTGSSTAHVGGVQGSLLMTGRMIAKLHREFFLDETSGKDTLCQKRKLPVIKKNQYKTQMTYPVPNTKDCHPLGRSDIIWGSGREYPITGEDFGYLIWRKRSCCLL
jgi:conjugal transfer pilus assembly protein TraU